MRIITKSVAVTTTGSDAAATGTATLAGMTGFLLDIALDFHATAPSTTDTTIAYATTGGNIVVVTDSATDVLLAPRGAIVNATAVAITNGWTYLPVDQALTVTLAGCNALVGAVVATFRILILG